MNNDRLHFTGAVSFQICSLLICRRNLRNRYHTENVNSYANPDLDNSSLCGTVVVMVDIQRGYLRCLDTPGCWMQGRSVTPDIRYL